jgi:hypothetical protein
MIRGLLGFVEHGDLSARISKVFQRMDLDENGGISFTELNAGLKKLFHKSKAACQLSLEDFEHVTAFGDLTDENDELDLRSFETMVMMQMRQYVNRQICAAIKRTNDDVTAEQMFGIKMIMLNLQMLENRFDRAFPASHQYKKKTSLKQLSLTQNGEDGSNVNPLPPAEPSVLSSDESAHGPDAVPIVSPASIDAIDFSVSADKTMKDLAVKAASLDSMMQKVSFSVLPFLHYMSHSIAPSVSLTLFCTYSNAADVCAEPGHEEGYPLGYIGHLASSFDRHLRMHWQRLDGNGTKDAHKHLISQLPMIPYIPSNEPARQPIE